MRIVRCLFIVSAIWLLGTPIGCQPGTDTASSRPKNAPSTPEKAPDASQQNRSRDESAVADHPAALPGNSATTRAPSNISYPIQDAWSDAEYIARAKSEVIHHGRYERTVIRFAQNGMVKHFGNTVDVSGTFVVDDSNVGAAADSHEYLVMFKEDLDEGHVDVIFVRLDHTAAWATKDLAAELERRKRLSQEKATGAQLRTAKKGEARAQAANPRTQNAPVILHVAKEQSPRQEPCRNDWPMYGYNAGNTFCNQAEETLAVPLEVTWEATLEGYSDGVIVSSGIVLVSGQKRDRKHTIFALGVRNGQRLWTFTLPGGGGGSIGMVPASSGELAVFGGQMDDNVYAIDIHTGELRWQHDRMKSMFDASPKIVNGDVFINSNQSGLWVLDAKTGTEKWRNKTLGRQTGIAIRGGRLLRPGGVYGGYLIAFDVASGTQSWRHEKGLTSSSLAASDERVYVAYAGEAPTKVDAGNGRTRLKFDRIAAIDIQDGDRIWETVLREDALYSGLLLTADALYAATRAGSLYCLDPQSGAIRKQRDFPNGRGKLIGTNDVIFTTTKDGIEAISPSTLDTVWTSPLGGFQHLAIANGRLYVTTGSKVVAFANRDQAKQPLEQARRWTDSSATYSVVAQLLGVEEGKAVLKKLDGSIARVPLAQLSVADRQHIESLRTRPPSNQDTSLETRPPSNHNTPLETLTNSIGMKFRLIPAGEFMMGSSASPEEMAEAFPHAKPQAFRYEGPQHRVRITRPFFLGVTEVTQAQYEQIMGLNPSRFSKTGRAAEQVKDRDTSHWPVESVNWYNAIDFCARLSALEGRMYRLPTEAEWEYACRAGTSSSWFCGDDVAHLNEYAWCARKGMVQGVARKRPNPWGLYDMCGNVCEWCNDWYHRYSDSPGTDPAGPLALTGDVSNASRVHRGGCWFFPEFMCRSVSRSGLQPMNSGTFIGFRVVLVPSETIAWRKDKAEEDTNTLPQHLDNTVGMKFKLIPAGDFMMGSSESAEELAMKFKVSVPRLLDKEQPQHKVRIRRPFYLGATEVTQSQYATVMGNNPSDFSKTGKTWHPSGKSQQSSAPRVAGMDTSNFPVEQVSWDEAVVFCQRLSAREGRIYRLPTEAEWEYACRAGSTQPWSFGNDDQSLYDFAWYRAYLVGDGRDERTHAVAQKRPNTWGLYDMYGNVREWCSDWFEAGFYATSPQADPLGPARGAAKLTRGGSWYDASWACRSAYRNKMTPYSRISMVGFRVVLVPPVK